MNKTSNKRVNRRSLYANQRILAEIAEMEHREQEIMDERTPGTKTNGHEHENTVTMDTQNNTNATTTTTATTKATPVQAGNTTTTKPETTPKSATTTTTKVGTTSNNNNYNNNN